MLEKPKIHLPKPENFQLQPKIRIFVVSNLPYAR